MYSVLNTQNINVKNLPLNSNLINYSILREFYSPVGFRSFSVKYVVEGHEKYTVNGHVFHVSQGQYLLAGSFCKGSVEIDSKKPVCGICIDVSPELLSQVVASHVCPGNAQPDPALNQFLNTPDFVENTYSANETHLGNYLNNLARLLHSDPFAAHSFGNDFYYALAENLVRDQAVVFKQTQSIHALKNSTRKNLYQKVHKAKQYMDECFFMPVNMEAVAREAALSEYHFYRLFKTVYSLTPNQYLVRKRLEKAHTLLKAGYGPVSFIAVQVGFPDVFSFSKSFKKHFGISPSLVFGRN